MVGAIDQQDEHPPHCNSYVSVTSADETAARAKRLGARILEEPFDAARFGRLARRALKSTNRHRRIMQL